MRLRRLRRVRLRRLRRLSEGEDFYEGGSEEGDGDSSEDDDTNEHAGTVRTSIGEAMAPAGFTIVDICPGFATTAECQQFTGQLVLVGWDTDAFFGWFVGTIHSSTVSATRQAEDPHGQLRDQIQSSAHGRPNCRQCSM